MTSGRNIKKLCHADSPASWDELLMFNRPRNPCVFFHRETMIYGCSITCQQSWVLLFTVRKSLRKLRGKKFFLAHGDGLDASDVGYNRLKKIFTNRKLQWLFSRLHPNFALHIAHSWSKSSRTAKFEKEDEFNVNLDGMYKFAESFLKEVHVDYFIFGHRHKMVYTPMNKKTSFVLLGDWIKNFSYGVFDGDNFELKRYNDTAES